MTTPLNATDANGMPMSPPRKGGSYVREKDGALRRIEGTEAAKTRADKDDGTAMASSVEVGKAESRKRRR